MWLEEPVPAENIDALVRVRAQTRTPICAGESPYLRWGFRELLERGAVDVIEPDVPKCGGLAEAKKIANLAEMHYIPFAPHLVSTPLGTMATAHQCGAIPNFYVQEWHALEERVVWDSYVHAPDGSGSIVRDGYITLPDSPASASSWTWTGSARMPCPGTACSTEADQEAVRRPRTAAGARRLAHGRR